MYFTDERKSYDIPAMQGLNNHHSLKKETINEEFEAKEFIPIEFLDSDCEMDIAQDSGPSEPQVITNE